MVDAGATEEPSQLAKDALRILGIEETDCAETLFEVEHEGLHVLLRCGLWRLPDVPRGIRLNGRHENRHGLGEIEDRKNRFGRNANDQVATIDVLPAEATSFVAKHDRCGFETSIGQRSIRFDRRQHLQVLSSSTGGRCREGSVPPGRLSQTVPPLALEVFIGSTRPAKNFRVVKVDLWTNQVESANSEICRHPHRCPDIPGQGRLHQNQTSQRHRSI